MQQCLFYRLQIILFFFIKIPTAAPENKETLVVLMPISHIAPNNEHQIDDLIKSARGKIIKIIESRLKISNFEELIETETINDPRVWQTKFNLWKGSILGLSHNITQVLHFRPGTRSHLFKKLYFVGASAHPGTGVPVVLCGTKLVRFFFLNLHLTLQYYSFENANFSHFRLRSKSWKMLE